MADNIPMWRVQTEGYRDNKGVLAGTVTFPDLDSSPDCEYIASGRNQKRPNAVAIGRQGNVLHWGFAVSPEHMTEEAQLVFVNAIHYIHKFEGQTPVVQKVERLVTRGLLDEIMWTITEEGLNSIASAFKNAKSTPSPMMVLQRFTPMSIREQFKEDWPAYLAYYKENRPFLCPEEGFEANGRDWQVLVLDEDAKSLGIPNSDVRILEKCISLLEAGEQTELAERVLQRYTDNRFDSAKQWRQWFTENRQQLFLSEYGGFKFLVFSHRDSTKTSNGSTPPVSYTHLTLPTKA